MVDLLDPRGEQGVQLGQGVHGAADAVGTGGDLDQELVPDGAEKTFDLAPAGRLAGLAVGELDPEHRAGPAQPGIDETGPVVDVNLSRAAPRCQRDLEGLPQRDRVLRVAPAGRDHGPRVVVQERDQDRLAARDERPVERIADPPGVRPVGLEPAEHRGRATIGAGPGQPGGGEVALQRAGRGREAAVRRQHNRDLCGGPIRGLGLEGHREFQHVRRGASKDPAGRRD